MKKGIFILLLLLLCAWGVGCFGENSGSQGEFGLYFTVDGSIDHGPAIRTERWIAQEECTPGMLLRALLSGPTQEGLSSPFPRGVTLKGWEWDRETGVVAVTLSEQYSGLTDIALTLADYCITMTLCQLEGVEAVDISTSSSVSNYRSHQVLRPEEVHLN